MRIVNISFILLSLVSIGLSIITTDIEEFPQAYLDSLFKGATCGQVYSNGNDSFVSIELEDFYLHPRSKNHNKLTIPFVSIRYSHLAFYKNLHTLQDFNKMYNEPLEFRRKMYSEFLLNNLLEVDNIYLNETLGNPTLHFGYLYDGKRKGLTASLSMKVDQSGIYCVFMVPPEDLILNGMMSAKVTYINSYGYLRYQDYLHYHSFILSSVIGTIFFIMMLWYYKFKKPKQSTDIGNFTSIYKVILFYCFGPMLVLNSLFIIPYALTNYTAPSAKFQDAIFYATETLKIVQHMLNIYLFDYLPVLFSMGYGIIYNGPQNCPNHKWKKLAKIMLFIDLFCSAFFIVYSKIDRLNDVKTITGSPILLLTFGISLLLVSMIQLCSKYTWKILFFYFHLQTIKKIRKFPVFEDLAVTERVIWSFRVSSLVFYFANFIIKSLLELAYITSSDFVVRFREKLEILGYNRAEEVYQKLLYEQVLFGKNPLKYWSDDLGCYIIFLLIFIIWNVTSKIILYKRALKESKKD